MLKTENGEVGLTGENQAESVAPEAVVESITVPIAPPANQALLERVSDVSLLPPALKERVEQAIAQTAAGAEPSLTITEVLNLLEGALPPQLTLQAKGAEVLEHPAGEAFFSSHTSELSDEQADRIARRQLQQCGMLRAV